MPKNCGAVSFMRRLGQGRILALIFVVIVGAVCAYSISPVLAQVQQGQENAQLTAEAAGVGETTDLPVIVGRIINIFLGFLGIVFLVLMLYAGYTWMTAAGDPEKIKKAQLTIRNALIGLVIIVSAWAITAFILGFFAGQFGGGGGVGVEYTPPGGFLPGSSGSLGNGIIEYHLPERNATNVPRNTPIIITFKESMNPESFIEPGTGSSSATQGVRTENIKIYRTTQGANTALTSSQARVAFTADKKTFVIKPLEYLGSSAENVGYTVELKGGTNGLKKADGSAAFGGTFSDGYTWPFEVSTVVDLTPPYVVAAIPMTGAAYARNIIIQINFSEAVDPTATTGKVTDLFNNIEVRAGVTGDPNPALVNGEFKIANRYQTVEFIPEVKCGTNSCGRDVFCLPGNNLIEVTIKAAHIDSAAPPQGIYTSNGFDGVVDVVGNSLDGNNDKTAVGPPGDNYYWNFLTTNDIKLSPPQIETTIPSSDPQNPNNSNVPLDQQIRAGFDTLLQASTLNSQNAMIDAHGRDEKDADNFWWYVGMKLLTSNGSDFDENKVPYDPPTKSALFMSHRPFIPSGEGLSELNFYDPYINSGVQDAYQNCFNPAAACGTGAGNPNCCSNSPETAGCKTLLHP